MKQGDATSEQIHDEDPVARAKAFVASRAERLHVIDLDGAFGSGENEHAIEAICRSVDVPVQSGGGIRSLEHAQRRVDAGATDVILGTLLVEDERSARNIIGKLGGRVIAGIDARGSRVAVRGWAESTPVDRDALLRRVAQWGVDRLIFTEILSDGMGEGYDLDALRAVATAFPGTVIASGGARNLEDLRELKAAAPANVEACIVGSALYMGSLDLREAIAAVS